MPKGTRTAAASTAKGKFIKVRYMGEVAIVCVGKASGKNYGVRNPKTSFYILKEDALHPESGLEIV
jgi:hypothetical protein